MAERYTTREALIAEVLGELDDLLTRVERLPDTMTEAETRLVRSVHILEDAGDKYRLAITAFTEEAKVSLTEYLQHKAAQTLADAVEEHRVAIQHAVSVARRSETMQQEPQPSPCGHVTVVSHGSRRLSRLFAHSVTAVLASLVTAAVVLLNRH